MIITQELKVIISELKKSSSKEDCLKKAYEIISAKYHGKRVDTYTRFFELFQRDLNYLWSKNGFLHCTNINYLLKYLLIESGFFEEEDIKFKWTQIWYISPHQYLKVRVDNKWIDIDIWAKYFGIEFGDHAHGLH